MDWRAHALRRIAMMKPPDMTIALSAFALFMTLFASGCIGRADDMEDEIDTIDAIEGDPATDVLSEDEPPVQIKIDADAGPDGAPSPPLPAPPSALCVSRSCSEI
jgi:hypothetical protein